MGFCMEKGRKPLVENDEVTLHLNLDEGIALIYVNDELVLGAYNVSFGRYQLCPIIGERTKLKFIPSKKIGEKEYLEVKDLAEKELKEFGKQEQKDYDDSDDRKLFDWSVRSAGTQLVVSNEVASPPKDYVPPPTISPTQNKSCTLFLKTNKFFYFWKFSYFSLF